MAQAYIFSASAAVVSAQANTVISTADATGRAKVSAGNLTVQGALSISSYGASTAGAKVDNITFAYASVGLMVGYAYAAGTFEAILICTGTVNAGSITAYNSFTSDATSDLTPAAGGLQAGAYDLGVNISLAEAKTIAKAYLTGGVVKATGAVLVSSRGIATSNAVVRGAAISISGVKVALNESYANVSATQDAYISGVALEADSVSVSSTLNDSVETGAVAQVGSNGAKPGVSFSFISGTISLAQAKITAHSYAYISGAALAVSGAVSVNTTARSYANADILESQFSVSVINVSLLATYAYAEGDFAAYLSAGSGKIVAVGSLNVSTLYYATANAATGAAGGLGVSLASADCNVTFAANHVTASSSIRGAGSIISMGGVSVVTEGYVYSSATGRSRMFSISAVSIAANFADARLTVEQSAYVNLSGSLNVSNGELSIRSEIYHTGEFGMAQASVGGTGAGASISLVGVTVNQANAYALSDNSAYLTGGGSVTAAAVTIRAKTASEANAIARKNFSGGFVTFGSLSANATTGDNISAYLAASSVKTLSGDVSINAIGGTTAYALCEQAGGLGLIDGSTSRAKSYIGTSDRYQSVSAGVTNGAVIDSAGDVTIRAYNAGSARSIVEKGLVVTAVKVDHSGLPTESYYSTRAYVTGNSGVKAAGSITVESEDSIAATSNATATQIGFAVSVDSIYGSNTATVTNTVDIKGALTAWNSLSIRAISNANLYAKTYADGGGFFSGSNLVAENTLTRTTSVHVDDDSALSANFGDLLIKALAGTSDNIYTYARIASGGVVALGTATANGTVNSTASVTIDPGVAIRDRYNTLSIYADSSLNSFSASVEVNTSGLGVRPHSTVNANIDLTSTVTIAGSSADKAILEGRYVNIESLVSSLYLYSYTYANGKALGADVDADTSMDVNITSTTALSHVNITGHDKIYIAGSARPAYRTNNIYGVATARLNAIGEGVARVDISGDIDSTATVGTGVSLTGALVVVTHNNYDRDRADYKRNTSGFIYKHKEGDFTLHISGSASVAPGTELHLGDAAGGIHIDISGTSGSYLVRAVGIKNDSQIWTISGGSINFNVIANSLPGSAQLYASFTTLSVYDQSYIPEVTIDNHTTLDIVLQGITVQNINFLNPTVRNAMGLAVSMPSKYGTALGGITLHAGGGTSPLIAVTNEQGADVRINGMIANPAGELRFVWTGDVGGALTSVQQVTSISAGVNVSPIWTNKLTIVNAGSVGAASFTSGTTKVEQSFNAYLFNTAGGTSQVNITSQNGIYLKLTAAELVVLNALDWTGKPWERPAASSGVGIDMRLQSIVAANGDVVIDLPQGVRAYQLANTNTLSMPIPGTLDYITDALQTLSQNLTISGLDTLQFYLTGYDPNMDVYSFCLPNGTLLYTDALGNVLRITENGVDFAIGDFAFTTNSETGKVTSITLAAGVSFDLTSGHLTVDQGASYETLLSAISGIWLLNNIRLSSGSIDLVLSTTESKLVDGAPVYTSLESVVSLAYWWSYGSLTCYYLAGSLPQTGSDSAYYILTYNSTTDTLTPYLLEKGGSIVSGEISDSVRSGNMMTDKDDPHSVTMKSGNEYYEVKSSAYQGSVIGAAVQRANQVYTFTGLAGSDIEYDRNADSWYYNGTKLDVRKINGLYYVPDNYTTGDSTSTLELIYNSLKGKYWSVDANPLSDLVPNSGIWSPNRSDGSYAFASFAYKSDDTNYYWVSSTFLNTYTLGLTWSSVTPLSLMICENESKAANVGTSKPKKDYILTFGTPVTSDDVSRDYQYYALDHGVWKLQTITVTEHGYANAVLSIQGRIANIPIKDVDAIPANNMLNGSGYRITDTLYVTKSGRAVMINQDVSVDGKYFAAVYDGSTYHSDYLNATHLGKVSQYNKLAVDDDGYVIYTDANGYVYRLEGSTFVYKGVRTGIADISGDSALEILKNGYFLDTMVNALGNIVGYRAGTSVLTESEALSVFRLGGTGTFLDSTGNLYFFEAGQMLCKETGISNISGATVKQWLLDHASYTVTNANGDVIVFSRDLTERDALKLIYGVDADHPLYTDASGNVYRLIGNDLIYQGAPTVTSILASTALSQLKSMLIGYYLNGKYVILEPDTTLSGGNAAYLLYTFVQPEGTDDYFTIDSSGDRYVLDASGNLVYSATPLPSDMLSSYTVSTLPAGSTVLTSDTSGNALTISLGGYIYNVVRTTTGTGTEAVTVITYEYTNQRSGVSGISADTMIHSAAGLAQCLYDESDLSKSYSPAITAAEALALLYPVVSGYYTDADGFLYVLSSGSLVYSGVKDGVAASIIGADVRSSLLADRDGYYYNDSYFTSFVSEAQALAIYYPLSDGVYQSGTALYRLDGATLVYIGSTITLPDADTSAYKSLQTLRDIDGNAIGYTHNGVAVSAENALKLFKLLGVGTFADADGNIYSFVGGQIVRTKAGETLPVITGESAVEWLLSHADGFYYVRDGVTYTFDASLTDEEAIRIRYSLTQDLDGEWYYTHENGSVYRLDGGNLVYDHTPATLADLTAADALITLAGMVVGYRDGAKTIYLDAGLLNNEDVAAFNFTASGGYYSDANGNRYTLKLVTSGSESHYVLNYADTPLSLPDLDTVSDMTPVVIPGELPDLYMDATGHLYQKLTDTQFRYIDKIYWLSDEFVTGQYTISDLINQIIDSADRVYLKDSTEKTFTKAEETESGAMRLIYGVTAASPRYVDADGYVFLLNADGSALVYSGEKEGVTPQTVTGADTKNWLLTHFTGLTALGRRFTVTPVLDSVSGLPTGEYNFVGSLADALRLVYGIDATNLYTDANGNVYRITGDDLIYSGTVTAIDNLTGAEALQWLYPLVNGIYTDASGNVFQLISGNLLYLATNAELADITGSAFDAIYYAYKAVDNSNVSFEMTTKKQVWQERLTDVLATDVQGRYYLWNGTIWNTVGSGSISHTSEEKNRTTDLIGGDGVTLIGTVTDLVRTVRDTITIETGKTTIVEHVFVWSADQNLWLQESVMIQLPDGTKVHSDGTIEPASADALTMHFVSCSGVRYLLGYIEATNGSVIITRHDTAGSLLDGNGDALNIRAGEDIVFYLRTTGTVGAPSEMLDVSAGHKVTVFDLSGDRGLISSSMYLFVPAAEGSITLEENTRIINGATYHVETENGDILGNRVEVIAGNLILDAHSNGSDPLITGEIQIDTLIVHYDPAQDATEESEKVLHSTATLTAQGDISIDSFTAEDGSIVSMTSTAGGLDSDTWDVDDSQVTASVHGDITLDDVTIANGSIVNLTSVAGGLDSDSWNVNDSQVTANVYGDITLDDVTIANGSVVSLTSTAGGLSSDTWDVDDSQVTANVYGNITLDDVTIANGSVVSLTSTAGGLSSDTWDVDDSQMTALVYGDIALGALTLTSGSTTRLTSTAGDLTSVSWDIDDSDLYANIFGAIDIGTAELDGGSATLYGKSGGLAMEGLYVKDGTWTAAAYGDIEIPQLEAHNANLRLESTDGGILFHMIQAKDSNVSMLSYTGIGLTAGASGNPLIQFAKDDTPATASLTLGAANGDIGSALSHLWIDIPAEITVRVASVESYFIDAVDLPLVSYPDYAVSGGWNGTTAGSVYLTGVYLRYSDEQFFQVLLGASTPAEIAAWVTQRATDREYLDNLDASALWSLVHSVTTGSVDQTMLNTLFGNSLGQSLYLAMTGVAPGITTSGELLDAVSAALLQKQAANPAAYAISAESARSILSTLLSKNLILSMGELLGTLLTPADVADFYRRAMLASTTPTDTYTDTPARAFHLSVGKSTGVANVTNEGDITISQDAGDMTLGTICSVRGDVRLDALLGSILAGAADQLVTGWNITLNAAGSVGTASMPVRINQRTNQPELLVNVDEEIYLSGLTAFGTAFGTRFDPAGAGTVVPPGIVPFAVKRLVYKFTQIPLTNADGTPKLDTLGQPVLGWALRAAIRYDWIRITDDQAATALNANAGGGVFVEEQSGALGLGAIHANGDVSLTAPETISDQRDSTQRADGDRNITATGCIRLVSKNGSLGSSATEPLLVETTETVLANCAGGTYLNSLGDLKLDLYSASGSIALTSDGEAKIASHDAAALTGFVHAAYGVSIDAAGDIGTLTTPLIVDANRTGAGMLSLVGGNVYVTEPSGDVYLELLHARGNAVLRVSGGLYDANIGSALNAIICRVTEAQAAATLAKASFDAAQAVTDLLNQYILRQNAVLPGQIADLNAAETVRNDADAVLTSANDALDDAQAAYDALLADPAATAAALRTAKQTLDAAAGEKARAQSSFDAAQTTYLAELAIVTATQNGLANASAQIAMADAATRASLYAAAQAKLAREQALLSAQVAVNDAEEALEAAQSAYDRAYGLLRAALDPADALRLAQGVLNAAKDILSAQTAINHASDVLDDPLATTAQKATATVVLANATLALNLAKSLKAIYENADTSAESLSIADAVLASEQALLAVKAAYDLDASADNLARLQQAQKTLQAAKDAFAALSAYLAAKDVSDRATALSNAAANAQADADAAQAVLDAYATLSRYGATADEKAIAQAVIAAAGGISLTQAQAALNTATSARNAAQTTLDTLLNQNGFTTLSEAVTATATARTSLDGKLTIHSAHDAANAAQAEVDRANAVLLAANAALSAAKSLVDAIAVASSEYEDAKTALTTAYQVWLDARLAAGSDEDKQVSDALAAYLAARDARDQKQATLNALLDEQTILPTLDDLRTMALAAQDALTQAQDDLAALLAELPVVTLDSFGADYAAGDTTGAQAATIHTGGTLTLITGSDTGAPGSPLSVDAGGIVTVQAGGYVVLHSPHALHIGGISGGNVLLTANGSIYDDSPLGGAMITADAAVLVALLGSIGTPGDPVHLMVSRLGAVANEILVSNGGDLYLGIVSAQGGVGIQTPGSIFQLPGGFVQAGTVSLLAGGNIGTVGEPVFVNTNELTARGGSIAISSFANLDVVTIYGNFVWLFVGGALHSGYIQAKDLMLIAVGDIGSQRSPVLVWVSGNLTAISVFGLVFIRNLYHVANPVSTILVVTIGGRILYLLLGTNPYGKTVLLGILTTELDATNSLNALWTALKQMNALGVPLVLLDGLGSAENAFALAFGKLFPKTQLLITSVLWFAELRKQVDPADWDAMLSDYAAIYQSRTEQEVSAAMDHFSEQWSGKYADIVSKLTSGIAPPEQIVMICDALREQNIDVEQVIGWLADYLESAGGGE